MKTLIALISLLFVFFFWGLLRLLWDRNAKRKKLKRILKTKKPKSLQEYLLIFPQACPLCGSREWNEMAWKVSYKDGVS
ncbi:MAG: hypothetical protein ACRDEA_14050, partial [Microcystaceae cyanobacterium]